MESAFVNVVEPGDEVLVCVNGVFGNRMSDIVERIGGVLHRIDRPWGEVFEPSEIEEALQRHPEVKAVFSPEKPAEHLLYAVHNRQELRIEVADQGLRHSLKDSPMNPGWTRPHEQAPPGIVTAFDHLFRTLYSGGPLSPPASWGPAPELPLLEDE